MFCNRCLAPRNHFVNFPFILFCRRENYQWIVSRLLSCLHFMDICSIPLGSKVNLRVELACVQLAQFSCPKSAFTARASRSCVLGCLHSNFPLWCLQTRNVDFFTSHEALILDYESAFTRYLNGKVCGHMI